MALVKEGAAVLIPDPQAREKLVIEALKLLHDEQRCANLSAHIGRLGKPNAALDIVEKIENLVHEA